MHLRIVFEDHKYQIEVKGLFRWHKLKRTTNWPVRCNTIDEAIDWANCYIEQQIEKNKDAKVIIGHIKI